MQKKILLVDDARLFLEVEKSLFRRTGAQILAATTAAEGFRLAVSEVPDLIILDLVLPDLPGDTVCRRMKTHPRTAHIPIVIATVRSESHYTESCRIAGCDEYLTKPLKYEELLSKTARLLGIPHRQCLRILVRIETEVEKNGNVFFGNSVDVSESGMLIETGQTLLIGDRLVLRFFLPGHEAVTTKGRVMRSEQADLQKYRYGVNFEDLPAAARRAIEAYVKLHTVKPAGTLVLT